MLLSYNNGTQYLSNKDFINHGFNADIDAYGNQKIRDASISQENQQRAKCLTSVAEVATRANCFQEIDHGMQRKEQLIQSKTNQKVNGMVQANVGQHDVTPQNPSSRLVLYQFLHVMSS